MSRSNSSMTGLLSAPNARSAQWWCPVIVFAALIAVGATTWQSPEITLGAADRATAAVVAEVTSDEDEEAAPPVAAPATPELPADALLPANDLTDLRIAQYWKISIETIHRLQVERALTNDVLAELPPAKLQRALWRLEHPKTGFPDEAQKWRTLRHRDEFGRIAPDGLVKAIQAREAMLQRQPRGGRGAGLPIGPDGAGRVIERSGAKAGLAPGDWTWIGPGNIGGRTRSMLVHPTNQNVIYAGSVGGGIWNTTNGGGTWAPLNGFSANLACSTMEFQPGNPNTIYAGTGEGFFNADSLRGAGVFKTIDGGTTWTQLASTNNSSFNFVNRIDISADGNTILAATGTGLFRSTNAGASWTTPTGGVGVRMLDVDFHPTDSSRAVCSGTSANVFFTTDGGTSWTPATGFTPSGRVEICYALADPNQVYISIESPGGAIYRSSNGGQTYALRGNHNYLGSQGWYDNVIWAGDPTNTDRVIVGGIDLWRSTNGGQSLTKISNWAQAPASAHADHHQVYTPPNYNGTTNQSLLFANDGGVYRGDNVWGSNTWTELNNNYGVTQFYGGSGNSTSGVFYGGTQDNGTLQFSGNAQNWSTSFGGDGGWSASDPTDPNYHYGEYVFLQIHRSSNGGNSASYIWNGIGDAGSAANFIAPFVLDPSNPSRMLAGGRSLWRSNNVKAATPTWAAIKPNINSNISAIAVDPMNSDRVYVGHNNGDLYFTTNGTTAIPSWSKVDGATLPNRYLERVAVDPFNGSIAYASFGGFNSGNLWKTTNSGTSWSDITGTLPAAPINGIATHPTKANWLYVGTEVGVFGSEDGGSTWSATNEGPVNISVDEVTFVGNKLLAVTHGRGMYTIIPSTGPGPVRPTGGIVQFNWNAGNRTLTLTGDAQGNYLNVKLLPNQILQLTSQNNTLIQVAPTLLMVLVSIDIGPGNININGNLAEGNDTFNVVSTPITLLNINLGVGNDKLRLSYCNVTTSQVDGGVGMDIFHNVGTTIGSNQNVGFP